MSSVPLFIPLENSIEKPAQVEYSANERRIYGLINEGSTSWVHISICLRGQCQEQR